MKLIRLESGSYINLEHVTRIEGHGTIRLSNNDYVIVDRDERLRIIALMEVLGNTNNDNT